MRHHGTIAASLTVCGLSLLLTGCSGWSYDPPVTGNPLTEGANLSAIRSRAPQSPAGFDQALTADYADLATTLDQQQRDWNDADYFSRKGLAAAAGGRVPPEDNRNWLVPLEVPDKLRSELNDGRKQLVTALDGGARDAAPAIAARAQVSYDCWVRHLEMVRQSGGEESCHAQFVAALGQLEHPAPSAGTTVSQPSAGTAVPPAGPREFRVYFAFNRADLLPEARQVVRQIAEQAKLDGKTRIVSVGKADLAGSDQYNLELSRRRADAVRDALMREGVPPDQIEARWVGERQPPVPTPAGVREQRNRVVEIDLQ